MQPEYQPLMPELLSKLQSEIAQLSNLQNEQQQTLKSYRQSSREHREACEFQYEELDIESQMQLKQIQMKTRQKQYKELLADHFRMVKKNKPQQIAEQYLREKCVQKIDHFIYEVDDMIFSKSSKSSIGSMGSIGDTNADYGQWLLHEKESKQTKEVQKLREEIALLEDSMNELGR